MFLDMLRLIVVRRAKIVRHIPMRSLHRYASSIAEPPGEEDLESFADIKFEKYFNRPDIDGWEVRKAMNDILGMDMVPYPTTVIAGLKACRRVNDFALAIRWLEGVSDKTGNKPNDIWPFIVQEIKPCLDVLGVNTPEELCFNFPNMALKTVFD